jgi:SEC-C motif-containing protein
MTVVAMPCPCGSGAEADACCGPILADAPAPTALALMRSRYTAYTRADADYLIDTHDPATRGDLDRDELAAYARATSWRGLEIISTQAGGERDETGIVEFIAHGETAGRAFAQHERSRFRRLAGAWVYVAGTVVARPV